jgi:predicted P-loop ATPase
LGAPDETFPRQARDSDTAELLAWMQRQGIHIRGKNTVRTVLAAIIADTAFHPVRDYLESLTWDGVSRLDTWLTYYLGVAPIPKYTEFVGVWWMISAVARVFKPGCIAKYMLVLEGAQDLGKSSALRILGGDWFTDGIAQIGTKDSQLTAGNFWIIEFSELDSTRRAHMSTIKAFISRQFDEFRRPYGENIVRVPRQSVLAATHNPSGPVLPDETGGVRFWFAEATRIDLDALRNDRDQLWAEAVARYQVGERWWPVPEDEFGGQAEQDKRIESAEDDPWFSPVSDWLGRQARTTPIAAAEVLAGAMGMPNERMNKAAQMRLGPIMRKLGYERTKIRTGRLTGWKWRLNNSSQQQDQSDVS